VYNTQLHQLFVIRISKDYSWAEKQIAEK
jgi:hypothetical protein